jgi:hypothetical protein
VSARTAAIAFYGSLCWAVIAGIVAGLLALVGLITWRDPTGTIIGAVAFGPFTLLTCGVLAASPFAALYYLLQDDSVGEEKGGGAGE